MSNELGEGWTSDVGLNQWHRAEIGPDDRTVTVHFGAAFSEDEVEPRLTAELSSDAVLIGLRLEPIVFSTSFSSWTNGPSHHAIEIVLAEPVAGRPIVDASRPPPPPPPVRKTIAVWHDFGEFAGGRRVFADSIDIYDDRADLNYRLRPGRDIEDDLVLAWDFDVTDDVGTEYDFDPSGGFGADEHEIQGHRSFPFPPPEATRLTLVLFDLATDPEDLEVGRVTVEL